MTDTDVRSERPSIWRRPVLIAFAAAAVLALGIGGAAVAGDDSDSVGDGSGELVSGPVTPSETSTGSCVEVYDLATLANRELAFVGTVTAVDGDTASFEVERWFRGGDSAATNVQGASTMGGLTSAGGPSLEPGTRLLVAGDGGFAWSCGFTQPYDDAVASQWADVFGG